MRSRFLFSVLLLLGGGAVSAQYPDGPGREILEKQCSTCHSIEVIVAQRHDAEEWRALVMSMIDRGAEITDEQVPVIVDYLAANWSKPDGAPAENAPAEQSARINPVASH